jgi:hypothetical protein
MTAVEYKVDRAGWPAGPWDSEPEDRVEWIDEATGLPCLMQRPKHGAWCGYAGVPAGHPWHGREGDAIDADVHGGLTYASGEQPLVAESAAAGRWWVGFDCVHWGDIAPSFLRHRAEWDSRESYRTVAYVRDEVTKLAAQARSAS